MSMSLAVKFKDTMWGYYVSKGGFNSFADKLPNEPFITIFTFDDREKMKELETKYHVIYIPRTREYEKDTEYTYFTELLDKNYDLGNTDNAFVTNVTREKDLESIIKYFNGTPMNIMLPLLQFYEGFLTTDEEGNKRIGKYTIIQYGEEFNLFVNHEEILEPSSKFYLNDVISLYKNGLNEFFADICRFTSGKKKVPKSPTLYVKVDSLGDYFLYMCGLKDNRKIKQMVNKL